MLPSRRVAVVVETCHVLCFAWSRGCSGDLLKEVKRVEESIRKRMPVGSIRSSKEIRDHVLRMVRPASDDRARTGAAALPSAGVTLAL